MTLIKKLTPRPELHPAGTAAALTLLLKMPRNQTKIVNNKPVKRLSRRQWNVQGIVCTLSIAAIKVL